MQALSSIYCIQQTNEMTSVIENYYTNSRCAQLSDFLQPKDVSMRFIIKSVNVHDEEILSKKKCTYDTTDSQI